MKKIDEFKQKVTELYNKEVIKLATTTGSLITELKGIELIQFTPQEPYVGELRNKIVFTYSDHYKENNPTYMDISHMPHPHVNDCDRGYIKGVVTDLTGYMVLRDCVKISSNFRHLAILYRPRFRHSKYCEIYNDKCSSIILEFEEKIQDQIELVKSEINAYLKERTGCSLLYYVETL